MESKYLLIETIDDANNQEMNNDDAWRLERNAWMDWRMKKKP
jgi:hypothetical protein